MPLSREPRSIIAAAEEAATAGDYASAEQLLRDAARRQEAEFGPLCPGLANTLNNLGVVCEITNKPADAELCYRKACAIAAAVLEPDHPFATTSRKNLSDFCEDRGTPIESPMALRADAAAQEPKVAFTIIAVSLSGLVLFMLIGTSQWLRSNRQADSPPAGATPSPSESPAPTVRSAEPIAVHKEAMTGNRGPLPAARGLTRAASGSAPTLAAARLCRNLSTKGSRGLAPDWQCDPATRPVHSGALFFYTRLKSPRDTTVQHRWYSGDRLYQAVDLRIRANQSDGYRTYSRYTVNIQSAGDWRVELRSRDGILLHEERFTVPK